METERETNIVRVKMTPVDFRRSDLYSDCLGNYYDIMKETLDTSDFVPDKFNKKIGKMLFREFKVTFRQAKKIYKATTKQEREIDHKTKQEALKAKNKAQWLEFCSKHFKRKPKQEASAITPEMITAILAQAKSKES